MTTSFHRRKDSLTAVAVLLLFLLMTALFIGLRPEHVAMAVLLGVLFFASPYTRKLLMTLLPFVIFAVSYDWMRVWPNYKVNDIDVAGLYTAEKTLFGIDVDGVRMTLCEFFNEHHAVVADFFAGLFYLCWVPVPVLFALFLFLRGRRALALRFSVVFLLVNLIGFAGYYIHPAAPPWYVMEYGFEPVLGTPGNVAGLGRFDALVGMEIFAPMYGRNANVFAALPSLHSAYVLVAFVYAIMGRCKKWLIALFGVITVGIWFTAVYSGHHYLIDVLLGILCALVGILLFEQVLMRWPAFRRFMERYTAYVS
ncbi:MAG TPA: inositol phosphorylceramide synthase [Candidatus Caccoplasma merdavium]|nr:inositol phosphorylceramide synthase [Candidatus Caccoplasma merdavium]